VRTAAQALADAGIAVEEVCPPALERVHALSAALAAADGRAWVQRLLANAGTTEVHPWLAANISQSQDMSVAAFTELLEDIDRFRSEMLAFMEHYDVILSPVNALSIERSHVAARATLLYSRASSLIGAGDDHPLTRKDHGVVSAMQVHEFTLYDML
jgi:Asp-tRNA(Asn)/Glu-tRNA(Gln) amidotransferase A subunit family amidase